MSGENDDALDKSPPPLDYASGNYIGETGGQARMGLMLIAFVYGLLLGGLASVLQQTGCFGLLPVLLITVYPSARAEHRKRVLDARAIVAILLQTLMIGPTLLIIGTQIAFVRDDPGFPQSRFRLAAVGPGIAAAIVGVALTCIAFAIDRRSTSTPHTIRTSTP